MVSSSLSTPRNFPTQAQYAQVSQEEATANASTNSAMESPLSGNDFDSSNLRQSTFTHMEEARHLTWRDSYYDGKHGIVAAFDRDTARAAAFYQWLFLAVSSVFWVFAILYWIMAYFDSHSTNEFIRQQTGLDEFFGVYMAGFGCIFVLLGYRAKQEMLVQHIAVSTEGIRIDNGTMVTITIPLEHIHSCEANEHKYCFQLRKAGFSTVRVQRTPTPMEQLCCCNKTRRIELLGIIRAQEFVDLVMAMKDAQNHGTYEGVSRVELSNIA